MDGIASNDIFTACEIMKKWVPPICLEDKHCIMETFTGTELGFGVPLLRVYIQMLQPYTDILGISGENNKPREADCLASGVVFFYGCLIYIMHFPNWGSHIEDIFLYNILYILVDHYIDDIHVDSHMKTTAIKQMHILIANPSAHQTMELVDPILKVIAITYQKLLDRCPSVEKSIMALFKAEIDGLETQNSPNKSREEYYNIALRKGGYTMQVVQDIMGNTDPEITKASYHIGCIMQLIDDSVDVLADKNNNIHTIATHDLATRMVLDELWVDIVNRINTIDPRFTMYVIIYTTFTVYLPDRLKNCYSNELRSLTNPLNLYDYTYGCDGSGLLTNAIISELVAMDALEKYNKVIKTKWN